MEHIAALLLVVGCSGDLSCRELPLESGVFETREECLAELPAMQRSVGKGFTTVHFRCVDVDPSAEEADAELVWDIAANGTLEASVVVPDHSETMVASNQSPRSDRLTQRIQ